MKFQNKSIQFVFFICSLILAGCASTPESSNSETSTAEPEATKYQTTAEKEQKEAKSKVNEREKVEDNVDIPGFKNNLPPTIALNQFADIEISPVTMTSKNADSTAGKRARRNIDSELRSALPPIFDEWKQKGANPTKSTLLIKADVPKIRIVPAGARFWGGAFAGRSNMIIKLTLIDKDTNEVIGTPEFYRHSNAFAAAWSGGAADRNVVERTVDLVLDYFEKNGNSPVETPTGR